MHAGERTIALMEAPQPGSPPRPRVPRPERWVLGNGLRVVALCRSGVPQVAMRLLVPAGSSADPTGYPGTASMVASLLTEGAGDLDADTLNARLDLLGASMGAQAGHDFAEVDLSTLSETLAPALELLAMVVTRPAFPNAETERVRAETLDALDGRLDEPANVADDTMSSALFGDEHPYGRLTAGTPEGVAAVPREVLVDFHQQHYRPEGSVLIVAGDFDRAALQAQLEEQLREWQGATRNASDLPTPDRPHRLGERMQIPWEEAAQGEIRVAGLGMRRNHPDWVAAAVANYLLGGSTITGRLGANLREDKGWTYGVRSGFAAALQPGGWSVETAVDVEVVPRALEEIFSELDRFRSHPIPEDELRRAKDALTLSLPRAFETAGRVVSRFATVEAFGLRSDYWETFAERVEAVTSAEIS
ncbi:MAG: insulinase family protein, partial [Gemmatimonadetes bacterium]|nr:insulinase family protein [Gemmatimonadota bacterium]